MISEFDIHPNEAVSPTSIRSRILKAIVARDGLHARRGFTHVDPFEDTESCRRDGRR